MSDLGPLAPVPPVAPTQPTAPATSSPAAQTPAAPPPVAMPDAGQTGQGGVSTQPQQTPANPNTVLDGGASEIDSSAAELTKGGQIQAQVVARDNAALLVRTAAGNTLTLAGNLAAKLEQANIAVLTAALTIKLNPENPQQATVVSANGLALQPPLTALAQPPTAAQLAIAISPPQPGGTPAPVLPQAGQALTAVVQQPQAGASLPAGSQLQVVVQSVTLPNVAVLAVPTQGVQSQAVPAQPVATPPLATPPVATPPAVTAPAVPAGAAPVLPTATPAAPTVVVPSPITPPAGTAAPTVTPPSVSVPAAVVLQQVQTPTAPPPQTAQPVQSQPLPQQQPVLPQGAQPQIQAPPLPTLANQALPAPVVSGQMLTGVVSGQAANGQVLVSTPQGVLALSMTQPLPAGTQLSLELAAIVRPPSPTPTTVGPPPLAGVLTRLQGEWPALQQTLDAVRAADPALAQRLENLLPQANARLAANALQFMAAAAAGNAQAWLGSETVKKLEQHGKGDLLKKLDDDFRELGRLNSRQSDTDWQALALPMLIGGRIEPIQIFMRRRKDKQKKQAQTRFIIDFDLESTGPIQFDGFISTKQLDLILRSEYEFGPAFKLDVTGIFTAAMDVTGMTGSIRFHDREKPLEWPSPELAAHGHSTEIKA